MKKQKKKEYKVVLMPQVKNFISKLPKEDQDRFLDVVNKLKKNPKRAGKKLKGHKGLYYIDF